MLSSQRILLVFLLLFVITGCSVKPDAFIKSDVEKILITDREKALLNNAPVTGVITLEEAIARALKYNLDLRTKLLEQSLASAELEAGKYDMLPKLMANAGYFWRNNENVRFSADPDQPDIFTNNTPFLSSEREHIGQDLTLSWNLLDFGASYYTAKQNADRVIIASENRRKAMHNLIQNVRSTYWHALAAEALGNRISQAVSSAEDALSKSRAMSDDGIRSPGDALRYQRNLLENLRLLESVQREVVSSRVNLANLMGLLPGTSYELVEPKENPQSLNVNLMQLEEFALLRNADLREKMLDARIAAHNTRKALLSILPNLSFDYGIRRDDDFYLKNSQWNDASVRVSYNLFNLLSGPSIKRAAKKNEAVAEMRRMALQMSVLTKVHLSYYQYEEALKQFTRADELFTVDSKLEQLAAAQTQSNTGGSLREISAAVTSILSLVRRYQAMSKVEESAGLVQSTVGLEPTIPSMDTTSLNDLTKMVSAWLDAGMGLNQLPLEEPLLHLIPVSGE